MPDIRTITLLLALTSSPALTAAVDCANSAVVTAADVTVSDGSTFRTESFFQGTHTAAIHFVDNPEQWMVMEGELTWARQGDRELSAPASLQTFVLGHQFHALLLNFHDIARNVRRDSQVQWDGTRIADSGDAPFGGVMHLVHGDDPARAYGFLFEFAGMPAQRVRFFDWQEIDGAALPFHVQIDDGEFLFDYRYTLIDLEPRGPLWFHDAVPASASEAVQTQRRLQQQAAANC